MEPSVWISFYLFYSLCILYKFVKSFFIDSIFLTIFKCVDILSSSLYQNVYEILCWKILDKFIGWLRSILFNFWRIVKNLRIFTTNQFFEKRFFLLERILKRNFQFFHFSFDFFNSIVNSFDIIWVVIFFIICYLLQNLKLLKICFLHIFFVSLKINF